MTFIKESFHQNMTLKEAETLILQTLKNVMEEKITKDNVEIVTVRSDTKQLEFKKPDYVEAIISGLS